MRALRPPSPPGGSPAPAPSPSPYQSPTPSPSAAFQGGLISSPPSPSALGSPGPAPVPAPAPEPNAVLALAGARRGGGGGMSPPLIAMLAVVGAALLVVLYARLARRVVRTVRRRWRGWRRRRRLLLITLTGGSGSSPANDSFASFTTYDNFYHTFSPYGLDDAAIKSLPSAQFLSAARASAGARDCAVCLLEFADGDELRALPLCAHAFHADCIDVWLRAHASCPLCRAAVALPAPVASSPLRSARRVRPSLDDLLFFHPVPPPPPPAPDALPEITPASPDRQLNPRDFLLKRSYSFGFERHIATEAASTASPTWRYRLGAGGGGDGASGRGRSFWSKRWPSPFGGAAAARVFSFRSAAAAKSSPFARRRAAAPAGGSGFFMSLGLSSEPPNILVAGRRSNRASSRLRCGDPEALLSPDRLSR
ncbi:hypothetical protein QYE76_000624 [Lolium multiflorum]|uniref:RING-type E3 ubiquitin transferase n=1 Tax=Lolium multiflorum TaxID=4521 RepID=A0AAD8RJL5_LOLMU|nr:hypothetical protein QYE76_000624 [Lolium multiflorum]